MEIKGIDVEDAKDHTYNFKIGNYCTCQPSSVVSLPCTQWLCTALISYLYCLMF